MKRALSFLVLTASIFVYFGCDPPMATDEAGDSSSASFDECKEGAFSNCQCEGEPPRDGMQFCKHAGDGVFKWSGCECPNACDQMTNSCGSCSSCADETVCQSQRAKCKNSEACKLMSECISGECDDGSCFFECAKEYPAGAEDYIDYVKCVECNACPQNCSGSGLCEQSCTTKCLLTFSAGADDYNAMYNCRLCDACALSCADSCTEMTGSGLCDTSGDCSTCINGDCSIVACSTETETCVDNPDCVSLGNCLASCLKE